MEEERDLNRGRTEAGQDKGPRRTKQEPKVQRRWGVGATKPEQSEAAAARTLRGRTDPAGESLAFGSSGDIREGGGGRAAGVRVEMGTDH